MTPAAAPPPRPPGRMLKVRGVPTHVLCEGAGPVCVLSGGLGASWYDWDEVVPLLTPHRTVVRFDRPGFGLSAPDPAGAAPTAAAEADRIAGVLDALGLTGRPCTAVGHSMGGFYAEAFARLYPDRAAGLVLLDGSVEEHPRPWPLPRLRTAAARLLGTAVAAAGLPRALGGAVRRLTVRAETVRPHPPAPGGLDTRCYRTGRVLRATVLENARYQDIAAELAALRAARPLPGGLPVTVLAAYDESGAPRELRWVERQRGLARTLGGTFRVAAPAGHLVMLDSPRDVAEAVLATGPGAGPVETA
ncbi:alpha/beta fold hydrolase [Streptomyces sp. URMC 123]|uniref:alpha/beta fold hydrolase n=1 Tax=Streptomyces sp. URMC 123 TaxID=3423403 RepID=UPI003F1BB233